MKKNVLVESTKSKFQVLEHKPANVLKRIKGVLSDFGSNRNGRIYPRELWENVINSDYVKEMINSHGLVGELDHPEERLEISLQEVSHVINDMWIQGDQVMGIIDILPTPNGKIVNELLDYGTDIGISSRGAGSVGAGNVVDPDYQFITFDFVARPSCEAARLNTILEGVKIDLETNSEDKVNKILESYKDELKEEAKPFTDTERGYVRYVNNWLKDHGHKDQFDIMFSDLLDDPANDNLSLFELYQKAFDELYDENGFAGELFVSYNEYLDNEQTQHIEEATDNYKERFMTYCEGKIKDLGTTRVEYYDRRADVRVAFIQDIRNFGTCKALDPTDCFELLDVEDAFCFLKPDGTFTATPMTSTDIVLARLEFKEIDQAYYDEVLKYWDDLDMEGTMMDQLSEGAKSNIKVTKESYKLDPSYKLNEAMTDQEVYKIVLNWYKDQIEAGKMTLNQCYELLSDKAKVSLNKLVDQSKIRESIMNNEIKNLLKEAAGETIYYSVQDADNKGFYVKTTKDFGDVTKKETLFSLLDALCDKGFIDLDKKEHYEFGFLSRARGDEAEFFASHGIAMYDLDGKAMKEAYGEPPSDKKYHPILNRDLEIESPLELNTGVLPLLDTDTYGRQDAIWGFSDEEEEEIERPELDNTMVAYGAPIVEEYIKRVLPSASVKGTGMYHPKYYNFSTDELEFTVSFDISEYNSLEEATFKDPEFGNFLKENYSDRSGFISYLADNLDEFYQQDGWKRFCQVVMFNLGNIEDDLEDTNERYWEDVLGNC